MSLTPHDAREFVRGRTTIYSAVVIRHPTVGGQTWTRVTVDDRLPSPAPAQDRGWEVTTRPQRLLSAQFGRDASSTVNGVSEQKGRAVYCMSRRRREVLAAIAYHIE